MITYKPINPTIPIRSYKIGNTETPKNDRTITEVLKIIIIRSIM